MTVVGQNMFETDDGSNKIVKLPETAWGVDLYAKSFDNPRWIQYRTHCKNKLNDNTINLEAWLLILTMCDETGNLLFSADDYPKFLGRNPAIVSRLGSFIMTELAIFGDTLEKKLNTSDNVT